MWCASLGKTCWSAFERVQVRDYMSACASRFWRAWIKARACKQWSKGHGTTVPAGQFHQSHRVKWADNQSELLLAMVKCNLSTQIQPCLRGRIHCGAQLRVMSFTYNYIASATCVVTSTLQSHTHGHLGFGTSIHKLLTLWGKKKNFSWVRRETRSV